MTNNNEALAALDELVAEALCSIDIQYDKDEPRYVEKRKREIDDINKDAETIRAALQQPSVSSVEGLKKGIPSGEGREKETKAMIDSRKYAYGWNDCIDHLASHGYLRGEDELYGKNPLMEEQLQEIKKRNKEKEAALRKRKMIKEYDFKGAIGDFPAYGKGNASSYGLNKWFEKYYKEIQTALILADRLQRGEVSPNMLRIAQLETELGAYVCANWLGGYDCIQELFKAMAAQMIKEEQDA